MILLSFQLGQSSVSQPLCLDNDVFQLETGCLHHCCAIVIDIMRNYTFRAHTVLNTCAAEIIEYLFIALPLFNGVGGFHTLDFGSTEAVRVADV